MKIHNKYLSYGIIQFIDGKRLDRNEIVNWLSQFECKLDNRKYIINAGDLITTHWNKFHQWVNEGLKHGTLKGRNISLSNGSGEEADSYRKFLKTLDPIIVKLHHSLCHKISAIHIGNLFANFHTKNGTIRKYRVGEGKSKIQRYYNDYQQIIDEGLLDEFKEYIQTIK